MKDVKWVEDSREQLRSFPKLARQIVGDALQFAQVGKKHQKAMPLRGVGSGVFEIVARYDTNTYRAVFILSNWVKTSMYFMYSRRNLHMASAHPKGKLT